MPLILCSVVVLIVGILLIIYATNLSHNVKIRNDEIEKQNREIAEENIKVAKKNQELNNIQKSLDNSISLKREQLNDIQSTITSSQQAREELSRKAFENYCEVLEKQYEDREAEYNLQKELLEESYSNRQLELMRETDLVQESLDKIKATRTAAIQAQVREKEIEEKLSFYCLSIPESEIKDIAVLETVIPKLNKPRVLRMLIWQTFFRTPMTNLCNNIIGTTVKSGIYKITNIKTKECYIGQAVDLASRWKDHCKAGLGIDTPAANKLYKAMQEYGVWNFSWEVLEEVPSTQLNEKEKYYIDLYDSKNFGYNIQSGTNK